MLRHCGIAALQWPSVMMLMLLLVLVLVLVLVLLVVVVVIMIMVILATSMAAFRNPASLCTFGVLPGFPLPHGQDAWPLA